MLSLLPLIFFTVLFFAVPAFAEWGDDSGAMTWGAGALPRVPMFDGLGLGPVLMFLGLFAFALRGFRVLPVDAVLLLIFIVGAADVAHGQTVTIPNTFANGEVADAGEVNENFQSLAAGVNAFDCASTSDILACPSLTCPDVNVPSCDTLSSYNQGSIEGAASVDVTID